MSQISILMNCYNGEKYLKEALDSVFSQTFLDWKIVFIDNCSTDNSAQIVKSYDNEKIEYYKTEVNVPLGSARNFGISKCKGQYLTFLDTDDIYEVNTLEILINEIENSDFILVYGGHYNINDIGEKIGILLPKAKEGIIFKELLLQFDIPTASSIINLNRLKCTDLEYDSNIFVSAEFCLFIQLSIQNEMKAINTPIIHYRVHSNSLTSNSMSKFSEDRRYTLNKIILQFPNLKDKFINEFKEAFARAAYYEAQYLVSIGKNNEAVKM